MANSKEFEAYRARVKACRAAEGDADKAHRAQLRAESESVRERMTADPRYHADAPDAPARRVFAYRRGDGNDGNFRQSVIELAPGDNAYSALRALVLNDFISGRSRRRFIARHLETDGEPEAPQAVIYEGPRGEVANNGAAWLSAELEPLEPGDYADGFQVDSGCYVRPIPIRKALDKGARAILEAGK